MNTNSISFKDIAKKGNRIDASYHLSEGKTTQRLIAHSPYPLIKVGDCAKRIWHAGRWRRVYVSNPEHGITLVGSSAMLKSDLSGEKLISRKYTEDIVDKILKKGWILISCSGTIGNCAFTNAQHAEKLASQDVIRINPNNILRAGLVYAYLSTKYGYTMLTQGTFGAVIQHIEPQHVSAIPIPQFPDAFQEEVDNLIQESARLRDEATEALDKAKVLLKEYAGLKDLSNDEYDSFESHAHG
ncbi:MAG: restriction endonuclease subunit S, partial [Prevotella sp.]|nr:restriction endonuclease subunit S [Prevotella sp.]